MKVQLPKLSLDSLDELFEKVGKLTKTQRILICVLSALVIIGPMIYFSFIPKHKEIESLTNQLKDLEQQLVVAKEKAKDLEKVRAQVKEAELKFQEAKKALPEKEEIPSLLTSISYSGQDSGLEFLLFQPESEKGKGFYAEIPVSINVKGSYHNTVIFFEKVSKLSRIVNIKNIRVTQSSPGKVVKENELTIMCTAVTYKFLESSK